MPEVPLQVITPDHARASVERAKRLLAKAAAEIAWQAEMESHRTLGYRSWSAFREAEYGAAACMVPGADRPELRRLANSADFRARRDEEIRSLRAGGQTVRAIADEVGCSVGTVHRVLSSQT